MSKKKCTSCRGCSPEKKTQISSVKQYPQREVEQKRPFKKGKGKNIPYLVLALSEREGRLSFSVPAVEKEQIPVLLEKLLRLDNENSIDLFQFEGVQILVSHGFESGNLHHVVASDN
ncbi:hypothetical protein KKC45_01250 [Patescibacteria group bacterium]|nr:hypothetical protein [Patescibacteria group bacterium]